MHGGPNDFVFLVEDWKGRRVGMSYTTYESHRDKHAEVPVYLEEARQTIADPDIVHEADNGGVFLSRFGLGRSLYQGCWLTVVVHYPESGLGRVATFYFARSLPRRPVLEQRAQ